MRLLIAALFLSLSLFADITLGGPFPALTLPDQHDNVRTVTAKDRMVVISFERSVSSAFHEFMKKQPDGFLAAHRIRYISDISAMPKLIIKLFALPKMKNYRYPVMLNRDKAFAETFDKAEGKLTVYRLNEGMVESVSFIGPERTAELFAE